MARRSKVVVDNTTTNSLEDSNVTVASSEDSISIDDSLWESVKMADFRFAMREFVNGNADGIAISWRGLVCKLLTLRNEGSSKQVFATVFERDGSEGYTITLRMRVQLTDKGIGYSLCSLLEHLSDKHPQGVFIRIDIRDTLEMGEVLNLLRQRFPKPDLTSLNKS